MSLQWNFLKGYSTSHRLSPFLRTTQAEDMPADAAQDAIDIITAAVDKFMAKEIYEKSAQAIKEGLDKRFGGVWHCCVGEGWSYSITPNTSAHLHVFYQQLGVLVFKC